jgi:hypothetical protein
MMKKIITLGLLLLMGANSPFVIAAADVPGAPDIPAASAEFRAKYVAENTAACVKGIEASVELKALYSAKTVEVYCKCRQRYRADVIAQAIKDGKRGKAVDDQGADYAQAKCSRILISQLEIE